MPDERFIRSVAETEDAVKKVPSLALALFPRPELLVGGDSWLVTGGNSDEVGAKAPNTVGPCNDTTAG